MSICQSQFEVMGGHHEPEVLIKEEVNLDEQDEIKPDISEMEHESEDLTQDLFSGKHEESEDPTQDLFSGKREEEELLPFAAVFLPCGHEEEEEGANEVSNSGHPYEKLARSYQGGFSYLKEEDKLTQAKEYRTQCKHRSNGNELLQGPNKRQCECGQKFTNATSRIHHIRMNSVELEASCACGKKLITLSCVLKKHEKEVSTPNSSPPLTNQDSPQFGSLISSSSDNQVASEPVNQTILPLNDSRENNTVPETYNCAICKNIFEETSLTKLPGGTRICEMCQPPKICEKELASPVAFTKQLNSDSNKSFQCTFCEFSCKNSVNLKTHMKTHENKKIMQCSYCEYQSDIKYHLERHLVTHTINGDPDNKSFQCSYCDYKCKYKWYLKRHMLSHSNEKPLQCPHCQFKCKHKKNLNYHILSHEWKNVSV